MYSYFDMFQATNILIINFNEMLTHLTAFYGDCIACQFPVLEKNIDSIAKAAAVYRDTLDKLVN